MNHCLCPIRVSDTVNQLNEAQLRFRSDMEENNHQQVDVNEVQHEPVTQAEYEKVVKGARLTDPVEEPISRSCTECIDSVCLQNDKPLFVCCKHIHSVDDNNKQNEGDIGKCYVIKSDLSQIYAEHFVYRLTHRVVFHWRIDLHLHG